MTNPRILFAPMEGITGYRFRNAHAECFGCVDAYYSPFLSANHSHSFQGKEKKDVDPENNVPVKLVPQILTNKAEDFLWGVLYLRNLGYREVNLNTGCPSSTVTTKRKGAGMLIDPDALDSFFEAFFDGLSQNGIRALPHNYNNEETDAGVRISVKTRLGYSDPAEAERLTDIYSRYPISELIVHARVRTAMYQGVADVEAFSAVYENSSHPVVYNGDIYTQEDHARITARFPDLSGVMIGRGLVADPSLARKIRGGEPFSKDEFRIYHARLLADFQKEYTEGIAVGRMKELWYYWERHFPEREREVLTVKKSKNVMEYTAAVNVLLKSL